MAISQTQNELSHFSVVVKELTQRVCGVTDAQSACPRQRHAMKGVLLRRGTPPYLPTPLKAAMGRTPPHSGVQAGREAFAAR